MLRGTNTDLIGAPYTHASLTDDQAFGDFQNQLDRACIAAVVGFPSDPAQLVDFARRLGPPMRKHSATTDEISAYVGDVRVRPDIDSANQLPTQGSEELSFHTARSYTVNRPRYFAMLMVNPGWLDAPVRHRGESLLVRWADVIAEHECEFASTYELDLRVLSQYRVRYKPSYVSDPAAFEPILSMTDGGWIAVRYWERMLLSCRELLAAEHDAFPFLDALERFDHTANSCERIIDYQMQANQLIVLRNQFVAHARRPFVASRSNAEQQWNPRHLLSIHIQ